MNTPLTDAELQQHAQDCGWHMECAYASFQAHGNPADRDAAVLWLYMQQEALRDLEAIESCECNLINQSGCPAFFDCMGEAAARRGRVAA